MATILDPYETLGARAPIPCDISEAHGVAQAALQPGTTLTLLPFRQPELLADELRIRVTNSGMCHSDVFFTELKWGTTGYFPVVPGHEIVGVVEKKGEAVTGFRIGERVGFGVFRGSCSTCYFCSSGDDNSCPKKVLTYSPQFGGYATSFQASADWFFHLPDEFPGESAPLFCAGATVYEPLKLYTSPGKKVGIMGIGGLGHLGIQFANKLGTEVTAISTSESKRDEAFELGAHSFLNISNEAEIQASIGRFDHILITSTVFSIAQSLDLLRSRGSLALVGLPERGFDPQMSISKLVMGNKAIYGGSVASRANIREMVEFCALHGVKPYSEVYPFAEAQRGFDSLAHGRPHYPKYRAVLETESFFQTFTPAS